MELMTLEERSAELARINKDNEDEYASAQKEVVAHKDPSSARRTSCTEAFTSASRDLTARFKGGSHWNKNMTSASCN